MGWNDGWEQGGSSGGGGGVTQVSSADTSIVVTNPTTTPSLKVATLDVLATNEPPAASVPLNGQKITGLGNGTAATDAAAFGQVSGKVGSVTATDGSIVVGGTATAPTIATGTLDAIAAAHAPVAAVALNAQKITGLGLASASTDAASLANTLNQFGAPAADVGWGSHKITSLLAGVASTDAANVGQLPGVLLASGAGSSVTGTLTETSLALISLTAGQMGANGMVVIEFNVRRNGGGTSAITWQIRFGAAGSGTGGTAMGTALSQSTGNTNGRLYFTFYNSGSASTQRWTVGAYSGPFALGVTNGTAAINTANASEINIDATLGNTGDTAFLDAYTVTLYPHS